MTARTDEANEKLIPQDSSGKSNLGKKGSSGNAYYDEDDLRPSSSRVKKVLLWNSQTSQFEMDPKHMKELEDHHIKGDDWRQFKQWKDSFNPDNHPENISKSCCQGFLLWIIGVVLLLLVFYLLFIILQLALFNLIMLVVMGVLWYKLAQIINAVITRILDNGRKKKFKAYVKEIKNQ